MHIDIFRNPGVDSLWDHTSIFHKDFISSLGEKGDDRRCSRTSPCLPVPWLRWTRSLRPAQRAAKGSFGFKGAFGGFGKLGAKMLGSQILGCRTQGIFDSKVSIWFLLALFWGGLETLCETRLIAQYLWCLFLLPCFLDILLSQVSNISFGVRPAQIFLGYHFPTSSLVIPRLWWRLRFGSMGHILTKLVALMLSATISMSVFQTWEVTIRYNKYIKSAEECLSNLSITMLMELKSPFWGWNCRWANPCGSSPGSSHRWRWGGLRRRTSTCGRRRTPSPGVCCRPCGRRRRRSWRCGAPTTSSSTVTRTTLGLVDVKWDGGCCRCWMMLGVMLDEVGG